MILLDGLCGQCSGTVNMTSAALATVPAHMFIAGEKA